MKITRDAIDETIKHLTKLLPPKDGYAYFFPSPNKGKRLLVTGWLSPYEATEIAKKILTKEANINDFDCVEEIN